MAFIQHSLVLLLLLILLCGFGFTLIRTQQFEKTARHLQGTQALTKLKPNAYDFTATNCVQQCGENPECTHVYFRFHLGLCINYRVNYLLEGGPVWVLGNYSKWVLRSELPRKVPHIHVSAPQNVSFDLSLNNDTSKPYVLPSNLTWAGNRAGAKGGITYKTGFLACGGYVDLESGSTEASDECEYIIQYPWTARIYKITSKMLAPRTNMASAAVDGALFLLGGEHNGVYQATSELYLPGYYRRVGPSLAGLPNFLGSCAAPIAVKDNSRVVVVGGLESTQIYEVDIQDSTSPWTTWPDSFPKRMHHACTVTNQLSSGTTYVVVTGGVDAIGDLQDSVYLLNTAAKNFSLGPVMPQKRYYHELMRADSALYVLAGFDKNVSLAAPNELVELLELDPDLNSWSVTSIQTKAMNSFFALAYNNPISDEEG